MLYLACSGPLTPENGSGGLVSKPYSVMNSGRPAATLPPVLADISSSRVPSSVMFAIVSESGWGSRTFGGMFFV